jgi:hypothetical protein
MTETRRITIARRLAGSATRSRTSDDDPILTGNVALV